MYLALQITGSHASMLGENAGKVFGEAGGTIGRSPGNDWVLQDAERFISSRHAIIRCMNSMFSLEDVSTNGVYMNDQMQPLGAGNPVILNTGDRILIGDYVVTVNIVDDIADLPAVPQSPISQAPFDPLITSPTGHLTSPTSAQGNAAIGPVDPLDLLGDAPPAAPPPPPAAYSDHSSAMSDYFSPPAGGGDTGTVGGIPDDWDLTDFSGGGSGSGFGSNPAPAPAPPAPSQTGIMQQPAIPQAGMIPPPAAAPMAGGGAMFDRLMPLVVQGMMDVLKSRSEIKSQFRLALTTIKPVENNPLKFSPNAQDAMRKLFDEANSGYLKPDEAIEEGFKDIKAHQMAMMAGMRAAFEHMLEQFSPSVLEERFEGGSKRGGIMGMASKVRYWDMYREMFDRITRDSDDNFRKLFGEEFASAYEDQMHKITRNM